MSGGHTDGRDRGAVLPFVALVLGALITMTAITVDLGRLEVQRRDLQAAADVMSLDLIRHVDGRTRNTIETSATAPTWATLISYTAQRNNIDPTKVTVDLGFVTSQHDSNLPTAGFSSASAGQIPNAVKVTVTDTLSYFFAPGGGTTTRSSVASRQGKACYTIGSFAVDLSSNPGDGTILGQYLNTALNLSLVSYSGLAGANVTLGDLATALGFASPNDLLTSTISYHDFAAAAATVLTNHGDVANAALLNTIKTSAKGSTTFSFGNLVNVAQGGEDAAIGSSFNVLDLIAGGAFLINGTNAIAVPGVGASIAGATVSASLFVTEGPQFVCGPVGRAAASTSQVRLAVTASEAIPLVGAITLTIGLNVANGTSNIGALTCDTSSSSVRIDVLSDLIAPTVSATLLGIPIVVAQPSSTASSNSSVTFTVPPDIFDVTKRSTSNTAISTSSLYGGTTFSGLAGAVLGSLLTSILAVVGPSTDPLFRMLGIKVAGADVYLHSVDCALGTLAG